MKYLRNFETGEEADSFVNRFEGNYGVLLSCDGFPVPLIIVPLSPSDGVSVTFVDTAHTHTYTYVYPYEPDTVLLTYIRNIVSEHEELQTGGDYSYYIYDKNENNLAPMKNNTLQEVGILAGDTLRCVETWR